MNLFFRAAILPLVAISGLSGCTKPLDPSGRSRVEVPETSAAVILPMGSPERITVIETRYANALVHSIPLRSRAVTPGENRVVVTLFGVRSGAQGRVPTSVKVTEDILADARAAFPSVTAWDLSYGANARGPFGIASGKGKAGETCSHAWQHVEGSFRVEADICDADPDAARSLMRGIILNPRPYQARF